MEVVGGRIELFGVVRGEENGEVPLEAVFHAFRTVSHRVIRPDVDVLALFGGMVEALQVSAIAPAIYDIVVEGIYGDVGTFAAGGFFPVALADRASVRAVEDAEGGVVLLRHIDAIGEMVIGNDAVKLCGGLVVIGGPVLPSVIRHLCASIVCDDHALVVFGCDPEVVVVAMRGIGRGKGFAAIGGFVVAHVHDIDDVLVFGIGIDAGIVPGTLAQAPVFVEFSPGFAPIVRAVHPSFVRFYERPYALGIDRGHGEANDTPRSFWQAFFVG